MSTNAKWTIGLLIAIVVGLGVGLIIISGDTADNETGTTVTVPTVIRTQPPQTETQEQRTQPTETQGGDENTSGPGNGGLGNP